MGWSDALPPPRDADHVATELNGLLTAAQVVRPIVLMGASRGGIFIRDYATRYPMEIAGLIFVDSGVPLQQRNPAFKADAELRQKGKPYMFLQRALFYAGIPRLIIGCTAQFPGLDSSTLKLYGEDQCHQPFDADDLETDSLIRSGEETVHTGPYGMLPILIFSHDPAKVASAGLSSELIQASEKMQEDLKKLSVHSRRIIAKGSGHFISWKRPELIEREVSLFIGQIRGTMPEPTDYGSTTTE
jgi:pimeloyl-ACP methyl ester carboxylesterase